MSLHRLITADVCPGLAGPVLCICFINALLYEWGKKIRFTRNGSVRNKMAAYPNAVGHMWYRIGDWQLAIESLSLVISH